MFAPFQSTEAFAARSWPSKTRWHIVFCSVRRTRPLQDLGREHWRCSGSARAKFFGFSLEGSPPDFRSSCGAATGSERVLRRRSVPVLKCKLEAHLAALVCMIVSGRRPNRVSVPPEASENYSIPDGSSMNNDVVSGEFVPTTELQELFESAAETITSLFKLSTLIRNATSRDRYARAMVAAKEPLDDSFDISQVGHKFPRVHKTPWLEQRLGKAITLRWQYLKYCHEHHHRLAKDKKHHEAYQLPSQEWRSLRMLESEMQQPNTEHHPDTENRASRTLKLIVASTLAPSLLHKTDDLSDENLSLTSYATSRGDDNSSSKPKVPSFPETAASGMPFECPYCWGIQNLEDERSWRLAIQSY